MSLNRKLWTLELSKLKDKQPVSLQWVQQCTSCFAKAAVCAVSSPADGRR